MERWRSRKNVGGGIMGKEEEEWGRRENGGGKGLGEEREEGLKRSTFYGGVLFIFF